MSEPSAVLTSDRGVWLSLNHPLAWHEQLYALTVSGSFAFVLVDTNSDLREIELTVYFRQVNRWHQVANQVDVGEIGMAEHAGYGWIYGGARADSEVGVEYEGRAYVVRSDANGHWAFGDESGAFNSMPTRAG